MDRSLMKAGSIIVGLVVVLVGPGEPQTLREAPVNPDFLAYQEAAARGEWASASADGRGWGVVPGPVVIPRLRGARADSASADLPPEYDLTDEDGLGGHTYHVTRSLRAGWACASVGSLYSCLWRRHLADAGWLLWPIGLAQTHGYDCAPDAGGNAFMAAACMLGGRGPVEEAQPAAPVTQVRDVLFLPGRDQVGPDDTTTIKQAVMDYGGVYADYFHSPTRVMPPADYHDPYLHAPNHAVLIMGWDDGYPALNFNPPRPGGDGAFYCLNNWTEWGTTLDTSRFQISYYDANLARSYAAAFLGAEDVVDGSGPYESLYQHDPLGWVTSVGLGREHLWAANVFTPPPTGGPQKLKAVGFYTTAQETAYTLRVYRGNPQSDPVDGGEEAYSAEGTIAAAGFHTITLDPDVGLPAGDRFSVVVRLRTPWYEFPQAAETWVRGYTEAAGSDPGESFYSVDGANWRDLRTWRTSANFCITAYCDPNLPPSKPGRPTVVGGSWTTEHDLVAAATATDPDDPGGSLTYQFQWRVDEGAWSGQYGTTVPASATAKGQHWEVKARAFDGASYSDFGQTWDGRIVNAPPGQPTLLSVSPGQPTSAQDLTASATGGADVDGDALTYGYVWACSSDNGQSWGSWGNAGEQLPAGRTHKGELWKARARTYDGDDYISA